MITLGHSYGQQTVASPPLALERVSAWAQATSSTMLFQSIHTWSTAVAPQVSGGVYYAQNNTLYRVGQWSTVAVPVPTPSWPLAHATPLVTAPINEQPGSVVCPWWAAGAMHGCVVLAWAANSATIAQVRDLALLISLGLGMSAHLLVAPPAQHHWGAALLPACRSSEAIAADLAALAVPAAIVELDVTPLDATTPQGIERIRSVYATIRHVVRACDYVAWAGNGAFVLAIPTTNHVEVRVRVRQLQHTLESLQHTTPRGTVGTLQCAMIYTVYEQEHTDAVTIERAVGA